MAIDTFLRVTIDPGAASKPDRQDDVHIVARAGSNGGDLTLAFDKAKVASITTLRSALSALVRALDGGNELTA